MAALWDDLDTADLPEQLRLELFEQASPRRCSSTSPTCCATPRPMKPGRDGRAAAPGLDKLDAMVGDLLRREVARRGGGACAQRLDEMGAPRGSPCGSCGCSR
jgi:glutamate dehydrogenase